MKSSILVRGSLVAAALIVACAIATPASAAKGCKGTFKNGKCYAAKSTKKKYAAHNRLADRQWHGWGASFHLDGVSYPGGNRNSGPPAWHNNYEGGFHTAAFWQLSARNLP